MEKLIEVTQRGRGQPWDWSPVVDSYSSDPFLPLPPLQVFLHLLCLLLFKLFLFFRNILLIFFLINFLSPLGHAARNLQ